MDTPRLRVLAIDDTPANLMVLATALSNEYTFQLATSGAMGLEMAEAARPDIVLLDVMMPEMDGYETCRRLKANPSLAQVPVVFVTALTDTGAEMEGLSLGAADYLMKPVNVQVARQRIRNLLERESLRHEVEMHRDHLEVLVAERTQALERANAELNEARERAQSANRVKSTFLQNMSHELLTPLNIVTGMASMLTERLQDRDLNEMSRQINHAGNQLVRIIRDILQLTRMDGEDDAQVIDHFDPRLMLREMVVQFQPAAQAKSLQLSHAVAEGVSKGLVGPSTRIKEVLRHFLSNAVKFTERGSVSIELAPCEPPPHHAPALNPKENGPVQWLQWTVKDTGIGLGETEQQRLFEAFTQADGSSTRAQGGLGVGLALCKHLAKMMNGEIGVHNQNGRGSAFWLKVACEMDDAPTPASPTAEPVHPAREASTPAVESAWTHEDQMHLLVLVALLRGGDAQALAVWQEFRPVLDVALGPVAQPFAQAMEQFDFDAALQHIEAAAVNHPEWEFA